MKSELPIRVRFAPSPTGMMHLGNVRTALLNYLFARHTGGTFVLRIEDTDPARNFDPGAKHIQADLQWLGLSFDEGPTIEGPHQPYFQSERLSIYKEHLQKLIEQNKVYRCFCTSQELDKKRNRQIVLKQPPRYDKTCTKRTVQEVEQLIANNTPFIWRMQLNPAQTITITDLARGTVKFELRNFSDFPVSRADGSFTFMFANFVDDATMQITHVLRGEDHLSNTAGQAALYNAFELPVPTFWHLPILCNATGKKLSKRDFGFSLQDLKQAGYLPETIINYLAIIGGGSFTNEIMNIDELTQALDFENMRASGQVKYDTEKLKWINHKWIDRYNPTKLTKLCFPFLQQTFETVNQLSTETVTKLIQTIKSEMHTLQDATKALSFYFTPPTADTNALDQEHFASIQKLISEHIALLQNVDDFLNTAKRHAKEQQIPIKQLFMFIRVALTGSTKGPSIHDLVDMLGVSESTLRIKKFL